MENKNLSEILEKNFKNLEASTRFSLFFKRSFFCIRVPFAFFVFLITLSCVRIYPLKLMPSEEDLENQPEDDSVEQEPVPEREPELKTVINKKTYTPLSPDQAVSPSATITPPVLEFASSISFLNTNAESKNNESVLPVHHSESEPEVAAEKIDAEETAKDPSAELPPNQPAEEEQIASAPDETIAGSDSTGTSSSTQQLPDSLAKNPPVISTSEDLFPFSLKPNKSIGLPNLSGSDCFSNSSIQILNNLLLFRASTYYEYLNFSDEKREKLISLLRSLNGKSNAEILNTANENSSLYLGAILILFFHLNNEQEQLKLWCNGQNDIPMLLKLATKILRSAMGEEGMTGQHDPNEYLLFLLSKLEECGIGNLFSNTVFEPYSKLDETSISFAHFSPTSQNLVDIVKENIDELGLFYTSDLDKLKNDPKAIPPLDFLHDELEFGQEKDELRKKIENTLGPFFELHPEKLKKELLEKDFEKEKPYHFILVTRETFVKGNLFKSTATFNPPNTITIGGNCKQLGTIIHLGIETIGGHYKFVSQIDEESVTVFNDHDVFLVPKTKEEETKKAVSKNSRIIVYVNREKEKKMLEELKEKLKKQKKNIGEEIIIPTGKVKIKTKKTL